MKKFFLSCLSAFAFLSLNAQLREGHIVYQIDATASNPEMQMAVGMMQGSTMDIYFKEKATRGELKMGSMMTTTTLSDENSGEVLTLMSGMMGNMAIKSNAKDQASSDGSDAAVKPEVVMTTETKVIHGYTCKKAVMTDPEGDVSNFWVTEDIVVSKKGQSSLSEEVPGFPLLFEINKNGLVMTMTASKVETSLPKKSKELFSMQVPEGYKEMTMDELKQMGMGGM
jgi:GLPGLI family protein